MAIYGAGSKWDKNELKNDFFQNEKFTIGWDEKHAKDLYEAVSQLKVLFNAYKIKNTQVQIYLIGVAFL